MLVPKEDLIPVCGLAGSLVVRRVWPRVACGHVQVGVPAQGGHDDGHVRLRVLHAHAEVLELPVAHGLGQGHAVLERDDAARGGDSDGVRAHIVRPVVAAHRLGVHLDVAVRAHLVGLEGVARAPAERPRPSRVGIARHCLHVAAGRARRHLHAPRRRPGVEGVLVCVVGHGEQPSLGRAVHEADWLVAAGHHNGELHLARAGAHDGVQLAARGARHLAAAHLHHRCEGTHRAPPARTCRLRVLAWVGGAHPHVRGARERGEVEAHVRRERALHAVHEMLRHVRARGQSHGRASRQLHLRTVRGELDVVIRCGAVGVHEHEVGACGCVEHGDEVVARLR
mmetsp:Transcript_18166/g.57095  ORF Transcript_18166/g.57095 Transcript_18166/m.57095 type:complete len:339 (-) Transcript_18166:704-1720(-)